MKRLYHKIVSMFGYPNPYETSSVDRVANTPKYAVMGGYCYSLRPNGQFDRQKVVNSDYPVDNPNPIEPLYSPPYTTICNIFLDVGTLSNGSKVIVLSGHSLSGIVLYCTYHPEANNHSGCWVTRADYEVINALNRTYGKTINTCHVCKQECSSLRFCSDACIKKYNADFKGDERLK